MKSYLIALCILLASFSVRSQELRIGHLETANDVGINWLFFHCNQAESSLKCTVFQTLIFMNQEPATCSVGNDFSEMAFTWNVPTQSWISREGPIGPCGRISIGTLERDPEVKRYWKYTEKKITTQPEGVLDNGLSCKKVPDMTLNYTWKAIRNATGCAYIKNLMN
jgi:hypothetical protein